MAHLELGIFIKNNMKTKTSHSWSALQPKTNDLPEWLMPIIIVAGFMGFLYVGMFVDWLLNLKSLLN